MEPSCSPSSLTSSASLTLYCSVPSQQLADTVNQLQVLMEIIRGFWSAPQQILEEVTLIVALDEFQTTFETALVLLRRSLTHWSHLELRNANTHCEGGIVASDSSLMQLNTLASLANSIATVLHQLMDCVALNSNSMQTQFRSRILSWHSQLLTTSFVLTELSSQIVNKQKHCRVNLKCLLARALQSADADWSVSISHFVVSEADLAAVMSNVDSNVNRSVVNLKVVPTCNTNRRVTNKLPRRDIASVPVASAIDADWHFIFACPNTDKTESEGNRKRRRRSEQSVTSEKMALVFEIKVTFRGTVTKLRLHSMPLVLTSHAKQYCAAWCTLFWVNAFRSEQAQPDQPFTVPDEVDRQVFLQQLQLWFTSRTGRALEAGHMSFLQRCLPVKVTQDSLLDSNCNSNRNRSNGELGFSFWSWFYKCTMLLSKNEQVGEFWRRGWLTGFISKRDACELVRQSPIGNSVIRFSTFARKGAVSVLRSAESESVSSSNSSWSLSSSKSKNLVIEQFGAWKQKDFDKLSLYATLHDLQLFRLLPWSVNWQLELKVNLDKLVQVESNEQLSDCDQVQPIRTAIHRRPYLTHS